MKHSLRLSEVAGLHVRRGPREGAEPALLVLPDVGHVARTERPDLVARAVLGMLEDRRQGAAAVP